MELLLDLKVAMKRRASGSSEPRKSWPKGCFDLDLHRCFFHVYFEEKLILVDLLNYCPSILSSGALPSQNPFCF